MKLWKASGKPQFSHPRFIFCIVSHRDWWYNTTNFAHLYMCTFVQGPSFVQMCWTCTQTNANVHSVACTFSFFCTFTRVDFSFYILSKEPCIPSKEPYIPSKKPSILSFAHHICSSWFFCLHICSFSFFFQKNENAQMCLSVFNIPQIAGMPQFGFASTVYRLFCKKIQCAQTRMLIFFLVAQGLHGGKQAYPKNAGDLWRANKSSPVKKRGTRDFPSWRCLCTIQRMSHEEYSHELRAGLAIFQVGDVCVQCGVWVTKHIPLSHELRNDQSDSRLSELEIIVYNVTSQSPSIYLSVTNYERDSRFRRCARVSKCVSDSVERYHGLICEWVPNTIRVPRVKHLVGVPHTIQMSHSYMLSESLIQFECVPHTFQMRYQRDSLDMYDSRCKRESTCIQTAQKACWNPAGVEPVYCRPLDVDPGALISGTYRNRTLVLSQWYKSVSMKIWKGLEILEMYLYNAIRESRTLYLRVMNYRWRAVKKARGKNDVDLKF